MPYKKLTLNQHFRSDGAKRILTLDGGGLRGIVTLGYLQRIENILRDCHKAGDGFRLSHYFDLIAGTSTGAIIAAALAKGRSVAELTRDYMTLGDQVFRRSRWRKGILRARYSHDKLTDELQRILGKRTTLGDTSLETGLLLVTKRMDTGSPWPLGNNPDGKYYQAGPNDKWISNKDYPLWRVVRASTAAPSYFDPEKIEISRQRGKKPVVGEFVDGGVSPFNNPALQALMYATLDGYKVRWKTGAENLLIVSVGTGKADPSQAPTWLTAKGAIQSLLGLMDDSAALVETIMQWLSQGETHRVIDRELGDLAKDGIGGQSQFTYARYDLPLFRAELDKLDPGITDSQLASLTEMDEPKNMELLGRLAGLDAESKVQEKHFPSAFDLL